MLSKVRRNFSLYLSHAILIVASLSILLPILWVLRKVVILVTLPGLVAVGIFILNWDEFLASPAADIITGEAINLNGGSWMD